MALHDDGSVTRWIGDLQAGGDSAAQHLWNRYFHRLVLLARARLRSAHRVGAIEDEEDAALGAFDSFCRAAAAGRFPQLADRDGLWRLLVVLTLRKVMAQVGRQAAHKRGGHRVGESAEAGALDQIAGDEPSPELAATVVEEYRRLRDRLETEAMRRILDLRMEGYTQEEIAEHVGCTERTVRRKLDMIREAWLQGES
jgi:DNA-directed RNA polymerase specialized sigma24 family protein